MREFKVGDEVVDLRLMAQTIDNNKFIGIVISVEQNEEYSVKVKFKDDNIFTYTSEGLYDIKHDKRCLIHYSDYMQEQELRKEFEKFKESKKPFIIEKIEELNRHTKGVFEISYNGDYIEVFHNDILMKEFSLNSFFIQTIVDTLNRDYGFNIKIEQVPTSDEIILMFEEKEFIYSDLNYSLFYDFNDKRWCINCQTFTKGFDEKFYTQENATKITKLLNKYKYNHKGEINGN